MRTVFNVILEAARGRLGKGRIMLNAILIQYQSALRMFETCVEKYDEAIWYDDRSHLNPAWHIAYHVLFFTNLYCGSARSKVNHWPGEAKNMQGLFETKKKRPKAFVYKKRFSRSEILDFIVHVRKMIPIYLKSMAAEKKCWPNWYDMTQFEFQLNNIRHLQHHTAQLIERHDTEIEMPYEWIRYR